MAIFMFVLGVVQDSPLSLFRILLHCEQLCPGLHLYYYPFAWTQLLVISSSVMLRSFFFICAIPFVLTPSQNKYNSMVQNLSHKECNFDLATTKDKSLRKLLVQKTSQYLDFLTKDKWQFGNLHLALIYVFGSKITFILGRRK